MFNEDETVAVVFNGELYNHRDLPAAHRRWASLPRGKGHRGARPRPARAARIAEMLKHIEGMFALAPLRSEAPAPLFLARDGFGIKLASTPAARADQLLPCLGDPRLALPSGRDQALRRSRAFTRIYLRLATSCCPAPPSSASRRCAPGRSGRSTSTRARSASRHFLSPTLGGRRDTHAPEGPRRSASRAAQRLRAPAPWPTVPTGVFLPGRGLDSSAPGRLREPPRRRPPKTFSMGFSSSDQGDERGSPASPPKRRTTRTSASTLGLAVVLGDLDLIIDALEEPLADTAPSCRSGTSASGTATTSRSRLSGEGGDEVLAGTGRYFRGPAVEDPAALASAPHAATASAGSDRSGCLRARFGLFNVARRATKFADSIGS